MTEHKPFLPGQLGPGLPLLETRSPAGMNRAERRRQQRFAAKAAKTAKPLPSANHLPEPVPPALEQTRFLEHVFRNVDIDHNKEILFAGAKIGQLEFLPLYHFCMECTGTSGPTWKTFRRAQRALILARYFDHTLSLRGARIECGVFKGFSSLMLSIVARMRNQGFDGAGFHIVDSFEGLSAPTESDAIGTQRLPTGGEMPMFSHQAGHFSIAIDHVQSVLSDFPNTSIHKGWIPDVFEDLPDRDWSFVHVDVDLYEPTKDCLEYFLPRLAPGGVIINDDFGSPMFPGGCLGWKEVMEDKGLSYAVLDTGQAVYVNQPSSNWCSF